MPFSLKFVCTSTFQLSLNMLQCTCHLHVITGKLQCIYCASNYMYYHSCVHQNFLVLLNVQDFVFVIIQFTQPIFFVIVQNLNHGCLPVSTCMHLVIWHSLYIHNFIFWKYNTCPYLKHMFWSCAKMMTVSVICIANIVC